MQGIRLHAVSAWEDGSYVMHEPNTVAALEHVQINGWEKKAIKRWN